MTGNKSLPRGRAAWGQEGICDAWKPGPKKLFHLQGARGNMAIVGFVSAFQADLGPLRERQNGNSPWFNAFFLLAWPRSEPSKTAQHSQTQCGLRLPAQVPIWQLSSMHRWHQRPTRPLVPWGTRCYLHACPGLQGTKNLAKTLWEPLNVKLHHGEDSVVTLSESRMACYNEITPQGPDWNGN